LTEEEMMIFMEMASGNATEEQGLGEHVIG
jgi:hypothetical protein